MIHVATIHWRSSKWIDVQLSYLARHVHEPYRVYASLDGVDAEHHRKFGFAAEPERSAHTHERGPCHAEKLNFLAKHIVNKGSGSDLIVFLDGDAFPIADLCGPLRSMLGASPLVAIRRDENLGDPQPHPSFCATTIDFWSEISGDWSPGHQWTNTAGLRVSDIGGKLLGTLLERNINWHPLLRTDAQRFHPIWFGVYGGLIYHHGAGFRSPLSRRDFEEIGLPPRAAWESAENGPADPLDSVTQELYNTRKTDLIRRNTALSQRMFSRLKRDEAFHLSL